MAASNGIVFNPPTLSAIRVTHGPFPVKLLMPSVKPFYKNTGYYVTGAVYETWVTADAPSTTPPSGHVLTNISYVRLQ